MEPPTGPPASAPNHQRAVLDSTLNQTSANLLITIGRNETLLRELLGQTPPGTIEKIQKCLGTLWWRSWIAKFLNSFLFWLGIVCLIILGIWPYLPQVTIVTEWLREHIPFIRHSSTFDNDYMSNLVRLGTVGLCGFCLLSYRRYKLKQTTIEDVLRRTYFWQENLDLKLGRLQRLCTPPENRKELFQEGLALLDRFQKSKHDQTCRLLGSSDSEIDRTDIARFRFILKDSAIKHYSYRNLMLLFGFVSAVTLLSGIVLVLITWIGNRTFDIGAIVPFVSVLILGISWLLFTRFEQYRKKRKALLVALGEVSLTNLPFEFRIEQLTDSIARIDDGMQK